VEDFSGHFRVRTIGEKGRLRGCTGLAREARAGKDLCRKKGDYFGSEAAGVAGGGRSVEKGLEFTDEYGWDLRPVEVWKKRQSQSWQRNGLIASLAKKASKKPLVLDRRVRSLRHHGQRNDMTDLSKNEWLRGKQRAVPARAPRSLEESRLTTLLAHLQSRIEAYPSIQRIL
jgi:hypothetical protein